MHRVHLKKRSDRKLSNLQKLMSKKTNKFKCKSEKKSKLLAKNFAGQSHYTNFLTSDTSEVSSGSWTDICEVYSPVKKGQQVLYNYDCNGNENSDDFFVPLLDDEINPGDECEICLEDMNNGVAVSKITRCVHRFHTDCIRRACMVCQRCPICRVCGPNMEGNCPPGRMVWEVSDKLKGKIAGYENCGVIVITYTMNYGVQDDRHQNPGAFYEGIRWTAYLPDNLQGNRVLGLFKQAWKMKRTFTIGRSLALGLDNRITWNDIHHKTSLEPNKEFGYPDPTYLKRVIEDMKAMGIH